MRSAKSTAFCQTSNFSKLNMFFSLNSQLKTLNFTCSFSALNARSRNVAARDAVLAVGRRPEIPTQTLLHDFHRRAAPRHRAFDVPVGNARRRIHRAPARPCTSTQRIPENQRRVPRVPKLDCSPARFRARGHRARILLAVSEFFGALRVILFRAVTFRISPREAGRARGGTNRANACHLRSGVFRSWRGHLSPCPGTQEHPARAVFPSG